MLLTSFAIFIKDRQQLAQRRRSGKSCVGFYVQRNCRRWGLAFSNTKFEKSKQNLTVKVHSNVI